MIDMLTNKYRKLKAIVYAYLMRKSYLYYGRKSLIISPLRIDGKENIHIGHNVYISYRAWLAAHSIDGGSVQLFIDDNVHIGNFNHIYAINRICIERDVLTADKVYITDNMHSFEDISRPIWVQPICKKGNGVVIGSGSWLGENVCVLGASIGRNCIIGANSVVTHDIPDYCVAVGVPAKVIKRYDVNQKRWRTTNVDNEFEE